MNTYQNENIKSDIFWMQKMVRAISSKEKKVFLITFFTILLARGFRLANYMPNHDTLWNFCAPQDVITSGRWSLVWAAGISSNYDLQWLNGVISILYIAMTNIYYQNVPDQKYAIELQLRCAAWGISFCCINLYVHVHSRCLLFGNAPILCCCNADSFKQMEEAACRQCAFRLFHRHISGIFIRCISIMRPVANTAFDYGKKKY